MLGTRKYAVLPLCLLVLVALVAAASAFGPIAFTGQGVIQGKWANQVQQFLGVPFAAPPVGDLRFKPPVRPSAWDGVRVATSFGPNCPQNGLAGVQPLPNQSEDCLYLNIWAPLLANAGSNLPVMVFLHGGGYQTGSGAQPVTDGSVLAATTNSIIVTVNYRLGLLGMLAHPAFLEETGTFGNYNIMDQVQALRWVQENIGFFGGNPSAVTLAGQSVGGISVAIHLVSPQSRGLFQQAIIESAVTSSLTNQSYVGAQGNTLVAALNCSTSSNAAIRACLRAASPATLLNLQKTVQPAPARPSVDGIVIPDQPLALLQKGYFARVPVLAGNVQNESTVFRANGLSYFNGVYPINQTYFDQFISNAAQFGPNFPSVVNQLYPASSYPTVFARLAAIEGDRDYTCQVRHYVDLMNEAGASDLYVYELRRALPYTNPQTFLGSFHSTDLNYVFGTSCISDFWPYGPPTCLTGTAPQFWAAGSVDYQLSRQVMTVWGNFLWNGTPGAFWPTYDTTTKAVQVINVNPFLHVEYNLASAQCAYWDNLVVFCGDGICNNGENRVSCPSDCNTCP